NVRVLASSSPGGSWYCSKPISSLLFAVRGCTSIQSARAAAPAARQMRTRGARDACDGVDVAAVLSPFAPLGTRAAGARQAAYVAGSKLAGCMSRRELGVIVLAGLLVGVAGLCHFLEVNAVVAFLAA